MNKKIISIKKNNNVFVLTWILNNICTNHCDYCPPTLHRGTNHHYDWDIAKEFINRLFTRYPRIHCSISGGEPTLSPFFPELVKMFHDAGHTVGITSNGARTIRYWEEISSMLSYICFSYHPSFEDPDFFNKVIAASKLTSVTVRIMMDTRYWNKSVVMYERCLETNVGVEPVRIIPETSMKTGVGENYTQHQLEWITSKKIKFPTPPNKKTNPAWIQAKIDSTFFWNDGSFDEWGDTNNLISTGQTDFRGWACNIGLESLFVQWDGFVKKGNCGQGGNLFHLNEHNNHEMPSMGEICLQNLCSCNADVLITKSPMMSKEDPYVISNQHIRQIFDENTYEKIFYNNFEDAKKYSKIIRIENDDK